MAIDLLIRGGTVVRADRVQRADVAVEAETIVEIAKEIPGDARETIDAAGLHVFPGVIDPHVHFNEPGRTDWEGFATGSAGLAAGGGTLFFDMPLNSLPPVLDGASFDLKLEAARRSSLTDFALWGGLTPKNLDRLEELAGRGVVGFKAFMCDSGIEEFPHCDDQTLQRGMEIAASLGMLVAVHAEDQSVVSSLAQQAQNANRRSWADFAESRPISAEVDAIRRACDMARRTNCDLHIVHVSSAEGINYVLASRIARGVTKHGPEISCETCPHYFLLDQSDLTRLGAIAKCAPPLRRPDERQKLQDRVKDTAIAFVASDHSPCPPAMKHADDVFNAWGGIAGVQSTLQSLLTLQPAIEPQRVALLTATNAARRFRIPNKGAIAVGFDADLTLVDLNRTFELKREDLLDRHKLSPYVGRAFRGVIRRTILRGRTIFADGRTVGRPLGRLVRPSR